MRFRLQTQSDVIAGAIIFGGFALLWAFFSAFADHLTIRSIRLNGAVLTPDHPKFAHYLFIARLVSAVIAFVCAGLCWLLFRHSRRVAP
jgi:hypothetical protein